MYPSEETRADVRSEAEHEPLYQIVLFNDDDHTYDYVCEMLTRLFNISATKAWEIAYQVDYLGEAIVAALPFDEALAGRDAIRSYGPDPRLEHSDSSMKAIIQAVEEA